MDGMYSGMESAINGLTLGLYNYLDRHSDNQAAHRREQLQQEADSANVGELNKLMQTLTYLAGRGISGLLTK